MDQALPALRITHAIANWFYGSWLDLTAFVRGLIEHPPTPQAAILALLMLAVTVAVFVALGRGARLLLAVHQEPKPLKVKVGWQSKVALARVTSQALTNRGLGDASRVLVVNNRDNRRAILRLGTRAKYKDSFDDDSIELSLPALEKLGLSQDDDGHNVDFTVKQVPWYTFRGVLERTIFDPDQSTSLTWRIFVLSLLASIIVSEVFYERGVADQAPATKIGRQASEGP